MENLYFFDERNTEIELTGMKDKSRKETIIIPIPDDWHLVEDNGYDSSMKYIVPDSVEYDDDEVVARISSGEIRTLIAISTALCDFFEESDYSKITIPTDVCILYDFKMMGADDILEQFWLPSQDNAIMEIEEDDDEEYSCVSSGVISPGNVVMGRGGFLRIGSGFCAFRVLLDTSDELIIDEDDFISTKQEAFETVREWIKETISANSSSEGIHHCETMFVTKRYPLMPEMERGIYYKKDSGMENEFHMSQTDWALSTREHIYKNSNKTTAKGSPTKKNTKSIKAPRKGNVEKNDISIKAGVLTGYYARMLGKKIKRLILPDGIRVIGESVFAFEDLEFVDIPEGTRVIEKRAFESCEKLKEVVIPEGVEEIGELAFWMCKSLTRVVLPSTIKKIDKDAFVDCDSLKEVVLPKGIEEIGETVFEYCSSDLVLRVYKDSIAESYAKEYNLQYEYIE